MEPIEVHLHFGAIDGISDRTARNLLKDMSKLSRRTQIREIDVIMRRARLNRRERQSLKDRLTREIEEAPVYYVRSLRAGSIELAVIFSAIGVWLLQATIGETIKSAWKEARVHKAVIEWMQRDREKEIPKIIADEVKRHDFLSGRAQASVNSKYERTIEITLEPSEYAVIELDHPILDDDVIQASNARIEEIIAQRRD